MNPVPSGFPLAPAMSTRQRAIGPCPSDVGADIQSRPIVDRCVYWGFGDRGFNG